ncbi:hypothetical protein VP01_2258g3 [Puccinia sorghi]|uniref:Uncharacterized protein n=1 Tax=Puccinia sorghi TaxID=27349 RepID=A0A0L6V8A3_9BASI|nr:hypothetical protein VP01_2258g3 [Puccinia sorghi]
MQDYKNTSNDNQLSRSCIKTSKNFLMNNSQKKDKFWDPVTNSFNLCRIGPQDQKPHK